MFQHRFQLLHLHEAVDNVQLAFMMFPKGMDRRIDASKLVQKKHGVMNLGNGRSLNCICWQEGCKNLAQSKTCSGIQGQRGTTTGNTAFVGGPAKDLSIDARSSRRVMS